ncbi:MAG: RES family NAD+ phosphorylase [bacterium]
MPAAWRLLKTKHVASAWDGEGARTNGGRWNSPGVGVVYTSESLSLALVEVLVHLQESAVLPAYSAIRVEIDDPLITSIELSDLPPNWRDFPAPPETRAIGDRWVSERRSVVLRVPSAVVPSESNYVLNPGHADFGLLRISPSVPFPFDPRLASLR